MAKGKKRRERERAAKQESFKRSLQDKTKYRQKQLDRARGDIAPTSPFYGGES